VIKIPPYDPDAPIVVIDIGNTHTTIATWKLGQVFTPLAFDTGDEIAFNEIFTAHIGAMSNHKPAATVVSSVVPDALPFIRERAESFLKKPALVVGDSLPLPLDVNVDDRKAVGVDRVCAAAAAYDRLQTGCTVIDFGTAITVDLIDDEGILVGGAILPGLRMQLRALHEFTAQLPMVEPGIPPLPYGRNTLEAVQAGVCRGAAGAVRGIVEGYATALNRWPQVVATGGDAAFLAPYCDFIDTVASHLVLRGIGLAYANYLRDAGA
jgi:type III pantothenate kinase